MANPTTSAPTFGRRGVPLSPVRPSNLKVSVQRAAAPAVSADMVIAYVGRNRHKFEPTIEAMERRDPEFSKMTIGWCWPAFFVPVIWLAYRKMPAAAALLYFATLAIGYVAGKEVWLSLVVSIVFAMFAKALVVRTAVARIRRILASENSSAAAAIAIRDNGGVSVGSAWIAIFLMILPAIAVAVQVAASMPH
jgi:hypothetical protein